MTYIFFPDFSQIDAYAVTIALVGYLVVFLALVMLYFVFSNLPSLLRAGTLRFSRRENDKPAGLHGNNEVTGEVNAAIGMAIFLYLSELHDQESGVLTIKKVSKRYSPWSSKIYGLRHHPRN
jgi:glutaconyl-CoA/methylmalonyl-CoA decarboxylase subunit delta